MASPESRTWGSKSTPHRVGQAWLCHIIAKPRIIETIILSTMQGERVVQSLKWKVAREVTDTEAEAPGGREGPMSHSRR